MWILSFIPDSWLHLAILVVLLSGVGLYVISFFFRFIPAPLIYQLTPYKTLISVLSVVLMVAGVYFYGSYDTEMSWRKKVEEAQAKVAEAEKKSTAANEALDVERKKKQKVITQYAITVKERIVTDSAKIDAECKVAPEAITDLNAAAHNPTKASK
jgi:apolipoprotein N-acyltransferase